MKKVLLLLADGFETYEASVFIDVMGWNLEEGDGTTLLYSCGLRKEIKSSFNQHVVVDHVVDEIDVNAYDALAIPGGFEKYGFYEDAYDDRFLNLIREFSRQKKVVASICVGALPVGKSGILKGKKGTTYLKNPVRMKALEDFGVEVIQEPVVLTDHIITSWNPSTAIEVALTLLKILTSASNADYIRERMGFTKDNS